MFNKPPVIYAMPLKLAAPYIWVHYSSSCYLRRVFPSGLVHNIDCSTANHARATLLQWIGKGELVEMTKETGAAFCNRAKASKKKLVKVPMFV